MAASFSDLRSWVNRHSGIATLAAIVLVFASVGVMANNLLRNPTYQPVDVYFYDLNTGELFVDKSDVIAPIAAPSDTGNEREPSGVRAFVYSCTSCADEASRFVAWLEKYTPSAKAALEAPVEELPEDELMDMTMAFERGHLVKGVNDRRWVLAESERAFKIMESAHTRCGDDAIPVQCRPE